ncbi:MAG: PhoH family protein [Thermoproteota archaeon]
MWLGKIPRIKSWGWWEVEQWIKNYRLIWLSGGYGSGKTLLAVAIAVHLVQEGFCKRIIANIPICHPKANTIYEAHDHFLLSIPSENEISDSVIILDEAGNFVSRFKTDFKKVDILMTFLRKLNIVVLLPSVKPIAKDLAQVLITRILDLRIIGLPYWVYYATLLHTPADRRLRKLSRTYFLFRNPKDFYPLYDSFAQPLDDLFITDVLTRKITNIKEEYEIIEFPELIESSEIYQSPQENIYPQEDYSQLLTNPPRNLITSSLLLSRPKNLRPSQNNAPTHNSDTPQLRFPIIRHPH